MSFSVLDIQYEVGEIEINVLSQYPEYAPVLDKTGMPLLYKSERSVEELAATAAQKLLASNPDCFARTSRFGGFLGQCPVAEHAGDCLVRLPLHNTLTESNQARVIEATTNFTP
jgi:dTDP-4-amino-4,6-dideoxygalactose transaminase